MLHKTRRHQPQYATTDPASLDVIAQLLTAHTWCGCNGWQLGPDVLILNDATSGDGAQEYAILKVIARDGSRLTVRQIESITFSWCTQEQARQYLQDIANGRYDTENYGTFPITVETPETHATCPHCA